MKKHERDTSSSDKNALIVTAFCCIGLCFLMMLMMLYKAPLLKPVNKIDYEYSQIEISSCTSSCISSEASIESSSLPTNSGNQKINLNKATKEELMQLSGIGETRAEDIIAFREKYGEFTSIEQLLEIGGIGTKTFEKIKDKITVEP